MALYALPVVKTLAVEVSAAVNFYLSHPTLSCLLTGQSDFAVFGPGIAFVCYWALRIK